MYRLALFFLVLGLYFAGAAHAASFDCAKAENPKERLICSNADLSAADSQLGNVYDATFARLSANNQEILRNDERNWLKGTSNFCPLVANDGGQFTISCLLKAYSYRISYLKELTAQSLSPSAFGNAQAKLVANAIQNALPILIRADETILDSMVRQKMLTSPTETPFPYSDAYTALLSSLPVPADADTQQDLRNFLESAGVLEPIRWLPAARIGGISYTVGNADCQSWMIFRDNGTHVVTMSLPITLQTDLCAASGHFAFLGTFGNQPVVVMEDDPSAGISGDAIGTVTIALQVWDGTQWSKPAAFTITYNYPLSTRPVFVSCMSENCSKAITLGHKIATEFNSHQSAATISIPLAATDATTFNAMQSAKNYQSTYDLSGFGSQRYIGFPGFGDDSVVFPARLNDSLVLGRIGHGAGGGGAEDRHWIVAFWHLEGTELEPVAEVIFGLGIPILESVSNLPDWQPELH